MSNKHRFIVGDDVFVNNLRDKLMMASKDRYSDGHILEKLARYDDEELRGYIYEVDESWSLPYSVSFYDKDLEYYAQNNIINQLYDADSLTYIPKEDKSESVKTDESGQYLNYDKIVMISDLDSYSDKIDKLIRKVSLIDLNTGVNRLNVFAKEVEDVVLFVELNKPYKIVFDIHDDVFKSLLIKYAQSKNLKFLIKENGDVEWKSE